MCLALSIIGWSLTLQSPVQIRVSWACEINNSIIQGFVYRFFIQNTEVHKQSEKVHKTSSRYPLTSSIYFLSQSLIHLKLKAPPLSEILDLMKMNLQFFVSQTCFQCLIPSKSYFLFHPRNAEYVSRWQKRCGSKVNRRNPEQTANCLKLKGFANDFSDGGKRSSYLGCYTDSKLCLCCHENKAVTT